MCHDTTKLLLGIDDIHIQIIDGVKGSDGVVRLEGRLDYQPEACPNCGIINEGQIINYGWRKTLIRFSKPSATDAMGLNSWTVKPTN